MNAKLVIAFVCGALIASGIVFMAVRPVAEPKVAVRKTLPVAAVAQRLPEPPAPALAPEPARTESAPAPSPKRAVAAKRAAPAPMPSKHDKPSPFVAPQERPVEVARIQEPTPAPPPPEPVRQNPPVPIYEPPEPVPEPPQESPHTVTIAVGTVLPVRIGETISARRNQVGDSFLATLDQPLVVDGFIIAERGSRVEGRVLDVGTSVLSIALVKLNTSDGQHVRIRTEPFKKDPSSSRANDIATVGAGAAIGAAIGAVAGGGKGAAIGAAAGGAAGAGGVLLTRGRPGEIPVETRVSFRLQEPVTLTERLN